MKRRTFVLGGGSLIAARGAGLAQTPRAAGKIGFLSLAHNPGQSISVRSMRPVWQRLGYIEGETVLLRGAEGDPRRLPALAAELIKLDVGVLIAVGATTLRATNQAAKTTPIVAIDLETDPVHAGFAATFGRPGGNITGLFLDQPSLAGKWVELLREAAPSIERVALVWDPSSGTDQLEAAKAAAPKIGLEALVLEVHTSEGYEDAFRGLDAYNRIGVVQLASAALSQPRFGLGRAALKYRLPTISFFALHAQAGALLSYGPNLEIYFQRAAILADQIIKGTKPGDLPIEQPDRFQLIINLNTARALGLTISPTLLSRADEVIE
jgi:putative ABC transport system substrate-binding protein